MRRSSPSPGTNSRLPPPYQKPHVLSGRATPYGHLGFITKLANHLIKLSEEDGNAELLEHLQANSDWVSWKAAYLEKVNEKEAIVLGGRDPRIPEPVDPNSPLLGFPAPPENRI